MTQIGLRPQQPGKQKGSLDFLSNLVRRWDGEAIIMVYFNDVPAMKKGLDLERGTVSDDDHSQSYGSETDCCKDIKLGEWSENSTYIILLKLLIASCLLRVLRSTFARASLGVRVFSECCCAERRIGTATKKGVLKTMESIRSKFFNGVDSSDRKISWWVWRFISGDGSLWCKVIQAIYGSKFDLHVTDQPSIWCSILREVKSLKDSGFDFSSHCKKRIGDGSCTSFWYDIWLADAPLCVQFPRLFALELDKEIVVANKMGASSVSASFRRDVRDGAERQQWDDLSSI
ncbi:hypothetical protein Tco_0767481, partial [Tanacetum coccineum]